MEGHVAARKDGVCLCEAHREQQARHQQRRRDDQPEAKLRAHGDREEALRHQRQQHDPAAQQARRGRHVAVEGRCLAAAGRRGRRRPSVVVRRQRRDGRRRGVVVLAAPALLESLPVGEDQVVHGRPDRKPRIVPQRRRLAVHAANVAAHEQPAREPLATPRGWREQRCRQLPSRSRAGEGGVEAALLLLEDAARVGGEGRVHRRRRRVAAHRRRLRRVLEPVEGAFEGEASSRRRQCAAEQEGADGGGARDDEESGEARADREHQLAQQARKHLGEDTSAGDDARCSRVRTRRERAEHDRRQARMRREAHRDRHLRELHQEQ
mmetsp:Transcript_85467/g.256022  ORF Transcript_85467/g.256022 Transcript_85467/m.256022 type:complete len:323 (+) Transcript_85467:654-1622(+)